MRLNCTSMKGEKGGQGGRWHSPSFLRTDEENEDEEEDEDVEEDEDQEIITVVYFWQGRDASEMGWLHFTHG